MPHVLLTGRPGTGKTTLIRQVAHQLAGYQPAGFYTEELRIEGARKGFRLVSLDGLSRMLAHVNVPHGPRIGRYGVDVAGFETFLTELNLVHSSSRLIVIDEIGKMECLSRRFVDEVETLLSSAHTIVATVATRGDGFIQAVKRRPDCRIVTVTRDNRDRLAERLPIEITEALNVSP